MIKGKKILIIGPNGSGKTTIGKKLAAKTGLPFYELDYYSWQPNWVETDYTLFRNKTIELTSLEEWIIDGNYARNQDVTLPACDTVIWLDVPHYVSVYRTFKRSVFRALSGDPLWHGNRESFRRLFSKDSVMKYAFFSYKRKKRRYKLFMEEKFSEKNWVRIRNRSDEMKFWEKIKFIR
ncbi:MAG: AAA family ATPase [Ignavibacteria bacterium]|nr:AAA family ATPase [Ignavibacteria bacterium]